MRVETKDLSGTSTIAGSVANGKLVLDVRRAGGDRVVEIEIDDRVPSIFAICLPDKLAALPPDSEHAECRQIQDDGSVEALRVRRDIGEQWAWRVATERGFGEQSIALDASGQLSAMSSEAPPLRMQRVDKPLHVEDLDYKLLTGRELLTFALDEPVGPLDRVQRVVVKLAWQNLPLADMHLEDARQRILSHHEEGGTHVAVLAIGRPSKPSHDDVELPIRDPAMQPYLAETMFVKPRHAAIVAAAREAIAAETSAERAVRALSAWVHGHITGELIAGTLTGPEVLACKRGKCTEYSTLFASLARAIGIPTRMALGERLMGNSWVGHMWNKAWVGRWVTVDASVDEVDHSLALLKFVHSDTVLGTQAVRWGLTESLAITVESVERVKNELERRYETGLVGGAYTNTDFACRIAATGEGWDVKDESMGGTVTVSFRHTNAPSAFIHFVAFSVPEGTDPKVIVAARKPAFVKRYKDFEVVESKDCQVAETTAAMWRFRGKPAKQPDFVNGHTEYVWIRGTRGYLLNMITLDAAHDADREKLEALLASFEYLQ